MIPGVRFSADAKASRGGLPELVQVWLVGPWSSAFAPQPAPQPPHAMSLWQHECGAFQVVVETMEPLLEVELRTDQALLEAADWRIYRVGQVKTRSHGLLPDPLFPLTEPIDLPPGQHAFWLSACAGEQAGPCVGQLELRAQGQVVALMELRLDISPLALPPPAAWRFHLDIRQHPTALADELGLPRWGEAHLRALEPYLLLLARAGQKPITCSLLDEPFARQSARAYPSMVGWERTPDGFRWNYEVLDRYAELAFRCGLQGPLSFYGPTQRHCQEGQCLITATDGSTHRLGVGDDGYQSIFTAFYQDLSRHLHRKGWLELAQVATEVMPLEALVPALWRVHDAAPGLRKALSGPYLEELDQLIDHYSLPWPGDAARCASRRARLQKTSLHTGRGLEGPNLFIHSPPLEATLLAWDVARVGADGLDFEGFMSWPPAPLEAPDQDSGPTGSDFLVYPHADGPLTTPRFEMLVEGIQDFERISLAREICRPADVAQALALTAPTATGAPTPRALLQARQQLTALLEAQAGVHR